MSRTSALAACLKDDRQPGKVQHELRELITQRVMAIALGYEDANDAARLAGDPIHKLLVGRDPVGGEDLASQPTLSRFENAPDRKELLRMTEALSDCVIARHRQRLHGRARRITIDLDPTDDPTHGQQEFTFFNRHYDSYCYLPMVCFLTFNEEVEQYLGGGGVAAWECTWFCRRRRDSAPSDCTGERCLSQDENPGTTRWRLRVPGSSGFSGLRTESGIPRQYGRQCGVEA